MKTYIKFTKRHKQHKDTFVDTKDSQLVPSYIFNMGGFCFADR